MKQFELEAMIEVGKKQQIKDSEERKKLAQDIVRLEQQLKDVVSKAKNKEKALPK